MGTKRKRKGILKLWSARVTRLRQLYPEHGVVMARRLVADRLGVTDRTVFNYEKGHTCPGPAIQAKIMKLEARV